MQRNSTVTLLAPKPKTGFYHVQTGEGKEGWVGVKYLSVESDEGAAPATSPSATGSPEPSSGKTGSTSTSTGSALPLSGQALFNALVAKRKTAVGQPLVENGSTVCGVTGDATNATAKALNTNKNRTDLSSDADYIPISWDDLATLPKNRAKDFQGAPVTVVGFLSHKINVENSGSGESTNCHLLGDNEVDWHIYLTKIANQPISQAIIVETTPRTRPEHKWTTAMLSPLVNSQTQVRVSGWLMYDSEHVGVIGTQRATVWEVHPITRIQVQQNGQWVDLDSRP